MSPALLGRWVVEEMAGDAVLNSSVSRSAGGVAAPDLAMADGWYRPALRVDRHGLEQGLR